MGYACYPCLNGTPPPPCDTCTTPWFACHPLTCLDVTISGLTGALAGANRTWKLYPACYCPDFNPAHCYFRGWFTSYLFAWILGGVPQEGQFPPDDPGLSDETEWFTVELWPYNYADPGGETPCSAWVIWVRRFKNGEATTCAKFRATINSYRHSGLEGWGRTGTLCSPAGLEYVAEATGTCAAAGEASVAIGSTCGGPVDDDSSLFPCSNDGTFCECELPHNAYRIAVDVPDDELCDHMPFSGDVHCLGEDEYEAYGIVAVGTDCQFGSITKLRTCPPAVGYVVPGQEWWDTPDENCTGVFVTVRTPTGPGVDDYTEIEHELVMRRIQMGISKESIPGGGDVYGLQIKWTFVSRWNSENGEELTVLNYSGGVDGQDVVPPQTTCHDPEGFPDVTPPCACRLWSEVLETPVNDCPRGTITITGHYGW